MRAAITYCHITWTEKLNFVQEKITSLNYLQHVVSENFQHLYIMLLDLKSNPLEFPEDHIQDQWTFLVGEVCVLFRGYFDEITDFPSPLFSIMLNLPNILPYSKEDGDDFQRVINALCDHFEWQIDQLMHNDGNCDKFSSRLISTCEFLTAWCAGYKDILTDRNCLKRCIQVLEHMNASLMPDQTKNILKIVWEKGQYLLKQLVQGCLNSAKRTELSERDLIKQWKSKYPNQEPNMRYLAVEGQNILCFLNTSGDNVNPTVYLIDRGPYTRLSAHWLRYESDPLTEPPPPTKEKPSRPVGVPAEEGELDEASLPTLDEAMVENDHVKFLQKSLHSGNSLAEELLSEQKLSDFIKNQELRNEDLAEVPSPEDLKMPNCALNLDSSRMFLSHAGLLSPKMFESNECGKQAIVLLKNSPKLQTNLETLDKISYKNRQTVIVLYARTRQKTLTDILSNTNVISRDSRFGDFAYSLGSEIVDILRFKGWTGLKTCDNANFFPVTFPYYSNCLNEAIFIIPSLLPTAKLLENSANLSGSQRIMPQERLIENMRWDYSKVDNSSCEVVVVWLESGESMEEFPLQSFRLHFRLDSDSRVAVIFVQPLENGLTRIKTALGAKNCLDSNELVVRSNVSSVVVREQCLLYSSTASRLASCDTNSLLNPRKTLIEEIIAEHQCLDRENGYFNCFFGH